jgi:hypothetical protein
VLDVIGPTTSLPLVASAPLQAPVAEQEVASAEVQVSVGELPLATGLELATSEAEGITLIVTLDKVLVPPAPVQVIE